MYAPNCGRDSRILYHRRKFPVTIFCVNSKSGKMGYVMHDVAGELALQRSRVIIGMTENY